METIFEKDSLSIKKFETLDDLEEIWKAIQGNSELYLAFESVKSYVNAVVGKDIVIYVLQDSEKPELILPIRFEKSFLGKINFLICHNFGFNLHPIGIDVDLEDEKFFIREVMRDLLKNNSIVNFEPVTKDFSELLKTISIELGFKTRVERSKENLYRLELKKTWKDFLSSLNNKFRKNLRYYESRIKEKFKIQIQKANNLDDLRTFFELHSLLMKDRGDLSILEFKKFQDYYIGMISSFDKDGGVFNLSLDDKIVASLAYVDFSGIRYFLNIGVNPEYKIYSVGRVLIAHAIEDTINSGMKYFDFGKGDSQYKLDWGCGVRENNKVIIWSSSLAYFLYNTTGFVYAVIKKLAIKLFKINLLKSILLKR